MSWRERRILWAATADKDHPWLAVVDGQRARLRLVKKPGPRTYVLVVDDVDRETIDEWPKCWTLTREHDPERRRMIAGLVENFARNQARAPELDAAEFERTKAIRSSALLDGPPAWPFRAADAYRMGLEVGEVREVCMLVELDVLAPSLASQATLRVRNKSAAHAAVRVQIRLRDIGLWTRGDVSPG